MGAAYLSRRQNGTRGGSTVLTAGKLRRQILFCDAFLLPMRMIVGITMLLLGLGMFACGLEGAGRPGGQMPVGQWVRTAAGWERTDSWRLSPVRQSQLHPLVVAAGEGLVSVLALAAFRRDER
jgi:hypothetical protein